MTNALGNALSLQNIYKRYVGIQALDNVSVDFQKGETHALVGENGAGKSTLIKIISGAEPPDSGRLVFENQTFDRMTPYLAGKSGVAAIYQEFNLFPTLTVAENIFMGDETLSEKRDRFYHKKKYIDKAKNILERMNIYIGPLELVEDMSTAKMQLVEITKAIAKNAKILIMDEPTAPLSTKETENLFELIRHMKRQGVTIIYISHRLDELYKIADRVTVLRDGKKIITTRVQDITRQELIYHMADRNVEEIEFASTWNKGDVALEVRELCGNGLKNISFKVQRGEILGIGGLLGAGRTELARMLFGADKLESGTILISGSPALIKSPKHAVSYGVAYVPEDRKQLGAILSLPINWNISLPILKRLSNRGFINKHKEKIIVDTQKNNLRIKASSMSQNVDSLSGGNQQKVVLAKWLAVNPRILILDEPTRGVDVSAKQEIYHLIGEFAKQGIAIILISSEMDELLNISDRLMVLSEKRTVGFLEKSEFSQKKVLAMASGIL
ncbi:MAG: sugar ABC transporter ATP-binding protein [Synergistaceae bacterium]|nr:sugar ABC transporter ATP-binding protein [Synergistaceae bacterium]